MLAQMEPIDWRGGVQGAWNDAVAVTPRLVACLAIIGMGWMASRIVRRIATRVLYALHLGRLVDRAGFGVPLARAGIVDPAQVAAKLIGALVLVIAAQLAVSVFGPSPVSASLDRLLRFLPNLALALAILVVTGLVARFVALLAEPALQALEERRLLSGAAVAAIWVIGVFAALNQLAIAPDIVRILFAALVGGVTLTLVIKFGVGGIWAARDRFWPAVYDRVEHSASDPVPARTLDLRRRSGSDR